MKFTVTLFLLAGLVICFEGVNGNPVNTGQEKSVFDNEIIKRVSIEGLADLNANGDKPYIAASRQSNPQLLPNLNNLQSITGGLSGSNPNLNPSTTPLTIGGLFNGVVGLLSAVLNVVVGLLRGIVGSL